MSIDPSRRRTLQGLISASTLAAVMTSGLVLPQRVLAHWPSDAFNADQVEDVLLALLGEAEIATDKVVKFDVGKPTELITDGQSVTVSISSELEQIDRIAILINNNPKPLVMSLDLTPAVLLPIKTRVKFLAGESQLIAVVRSGDKLYKTTRNVRVYAGGVP